MASESLEVVTLTVGMFSSNCHIVRAPGQPKALVIDPGGEPETIIGWLEQEGLQVARYLLTHGHVDHVHALAAVAERFPAPVDLHPGDRPWAFTAANAMLPWYDTPRSPRAIDRELAEGQVASELGHRYRVMETPGHSPGSVSFYFEDDGLLFSGDVLFQGSIGRTDLPNGDPAVLSASLDRLLTLPDTTVVYSGHGPKTTLGRERRTNPFLRDRSWAAPS